ncbi:signal peptidase II [bacterium]|jgi:signal peptidase II|nr:signal peptidase II [bacterium]
MMDDADNQNEPTAVSARFTGPSVRLMAVLFLGVLVSDQITKQIMLDWIFAHPQRYQVFPFLNFVPVWNPGISFGLFADGGVWVRAGLTVLAFLVSGWFFWHSRTLDRWQVIAGGLISGGAIGNAIDRLRFGKVVDFIDVFVQTWHWPAFNVADAAITIGACFWIYGSVFGQEIGEK